jgi:hypothetical protein
VRRIRISTWILVAVFLAAMATYILVRPNTGQSGTPPAPASTTATTAVVLPAISR